MDHLPQDCIMLKKKRGEAVGGAKAERKRWAEHTRQGRGHTHEESTQMDGPFFRCLSIPERAQERAPLVCTLLD